jgi:uncharacterized protein YybS (DUF2232 family)
MVRDIAIGIGLTLLVFAAAVRIPVLGFFGVLLAPLPTLFYRIKLGRQPTLAIPAVGLGAMIIADGGQSADLFFFMALLLLGFVLGELFERRLSIEQTVLAACGVVTAVCGGALIVVGIIGGQGLIPLVNAYVVQNLKAALDLYQAMGMTEENIRSIAESLDHIAYVMVRILPAMGIMTLLVVVWANLIMAKALLIRRRLPVPEFGRLECWKAPEVLVWVVITAGASLMIPHTALKLIGVNVLMVMITIYFFQGIAIVAYYFDRKGVPRPLRIFLYSLAAVQQLILLLIIVMGFFDVWFNFRRLGTENSR